MTEKEFKNLHRSDIVRSKLSGDSYIVDGNFGGRVTAVRTKDLTNPGEWDLIMKANYHCDPNMKNIEYRE